MSSCENKITLDTSIKYALLIVFSLIFVTSFHDVHAVNSIEWTYAGIPLDSILPDLPTASIINGEIASPDFPISVQVDATDELDSDGVAFTSNDKIDTIDVLITSSDDPSGTTYTLTETGINDGIFTGTNFVFLQGDYRLRISDTVTIIINDDPSTGCDTDDTVTQLDGTDALSADGVKVFSDSEPSGIGFLLTETGPNTCEFQAKLRFSTASSDVDTGTLKVSKGDIITILDLKDNDVFNAQITPTINGKGSIKATFDNPNDIETAEVTATYNLLSASLDLNDDGAGGRGGGGLIKPGLVVDSVGGRGLSESIPPTLGLDSNHDRIVEKGFSFNGNAVDVQEFYTPYPLITTAVGKLNSIKLKIYDDKGPENIIHAAISYGLGKGEIFNEGRATIEFDRLFGEENVSVYDPNHVLGDVAVTTSTVNCSSNGSDMCLEVTFDHMFREPLEYNMVASNVWDRERNGWQNYFNHGIEIVGDSLNPPDEYSGIYEGRLYSLVSTGKNTAVDDYGYSWTFDKIWNRDYVKIEKPDHDILNPEKIRALEHLGYGYSDGKKIFGFDRYDSRFADDKNQQMLIARDVMSLLCPECQNAPYEKIGNTFSYSFSSKTNKLTNPIIIKQMSIEEQKAKNYLDAFFEEIYPSKIND